MIGSRLVAVVLGALMFVTACSSDGDGETAAPIDDAETTATSEPETEPTPDPEPELEPTATPDPDPEPEVDPTCEAEPGLTTTNLTAAGNEYEVRIFVPSSVDAESSLSLVLNWHGLGSTGTEQALFTGYEALAETEGFVVVHPTGLEGPGGRNSWQLVADAAAGRDDLAFADLLIDEMIANWCVDPTRVYSTGMSNGGYFTARLVCERADRIAAAVSVAATSHPDSCEPGEPVPYLAFHGTDDEVVPFDGSGQSSLLGPNPDTAAVALFSLVIPDEFAEFAADSSCTAEPTVTDVSDEVIRYDYTGCTGDAPYSFVEVVGGGHTWPNSPLAGVLESSFGYFTPDIDATVDGWAFMAPHTDD